MHPSGWCKVVHPGDAMPLIEEGLGLLITMWADAAAERWWGASPAWVYKRHGTPLLLDVEDRHHLLRLDALAPERRTPRCSVQWVLVDREGGPAMAAICCLCGRSPQAVRKAERAVRGLVGARAAWVAHKEELAAALRRRLSGGGAPLH